MTYLYSVVVPFVEEEEDVEKEEPDKSFTVSICFNGGVEVNEDTSSFLEVEQNDGFKAKANAKVLEIMIEVKQTSFKVRSKNLWLR